MDFWHGGLFENYLEENSAHNATLGMDAVPLEDEFAPGTPPPQNVWEDGVVGNCARSGGSEEVGGTVGDESGGEEAALGRKRGSFVLDPEVESAKRKKRSINADRCANAGVGRFRHHLKGIGVASCFVENFWEIGWELLNDLICDWICKLEGAKKKALSPRTINSRFNGLNRRLTDVAELNLRDVEPFASDCLTVLGNEIRALQSDGAIPGQRACLTRIAANICARALVARATYCATSAVYFWRRSPSLATEGGKGCGG